MRVSIMICCCYYLIFSFGCQPKQGNPNTEIPENPDVLPEDFIEFYKRFHSDSTYQIAHIVFPLTSIVQDTSGRDSTVTWSAENWKLHASVTPDDFWAVDFTVPFEGVVTEFIHVRTGGYWMERRFAKMDTAWNLIYYGGLQSSDGITDDEASTLEF